eukprot:scaffold1827_cov421-Prasinococcus_capsulatus_cf.AAC.22
MFAALRAGPAAAVVRRAAAAPTRPQRGTARPGALGRLRRPRSVVRVAAQPPYKYPRGARTPRPLSTRTRG